MSRIKTLQKSPYGNCQVQSPNGTHIFNCNIKKVNWYIKRNLAVVIQKEPVIIRLLFEPKKNGNAGDLFYLQKRDNICVSCGSHEELTKHHIFPYCYKQYLSDELKNHASYDILPLCIKCHGKYEIDANKLKNDILQELNISNDDSEMMVFDSNLKKVCSAASALVVYDGYIPKNRHDKLSEVVRNYYGRDFTREDLEAASQLQYSTHRNNYKSVYQKVVESISDIDAFVRRWRSHFIDSLSPQYMPQYWNIERPFRNRDK